MTKKILVVEDNELNLKLFCDLLEAHEFGTVRARDGAAVMEMVRDEQPNLIIMDIQLPKISGLDVTRQLKADPFLKEIPVIAVTAFAMKGDEDRIRDGGCDAFIAKPISVRGFIDTVRQFI